MVQLLMILMYGSIYLHDEFRPEVTLGPDPARYPIRVAGITLAGFWIIWTVFHTYAAWCGRKIDTTGRVRWVRKAEQGLTIARVAATGWWIFAIFQLDWLGAVRAQIGDLILVDELVTMSPFIALLVGAWWSIYPVERRFHEALLVRHLDDPHGFPIHPLLTRAEQVWMNARHQMLLWMVPLTLLMGWQELLVMHGEALAHGLDGLMRRGGERLMPAVQLLGMLTIITVTPAIMRLVWDTVRIGPGPLADQVHAMCRRYRVRVGGPLLWRTRGSMVNGAILGVIWPLRYMLLTDALLERLTPAQVEAVMAHEVAHVRRRHLIWLGVCVLATVLVSLWAIAGAAGLLHELTGKDASEDLISLAAGVLGLGGAGFVFGLVSRRFEWQADAFAVQHLSRVEAESTPPAPGAGPRVTPTAVATMASALQAVADLNGIAANKFSWRHGSIRQRQDRLFKLVHVPLAAAPIDRQVMVIKLIAGIALAAGIASMIVGEIFHWISLSF